MTVLAQIGIEIVRRRRGEALKLLSRPGPLLLWLDALMRRAGFPSESG